MPSALRLWILGVGLAALGLGLGGWMRLDREVQRDRFPPTPGWVDARGQVDLARFPTRIPVVDAQGRHGGWGLDRSAGGAVLYGSALEIRNADPFTCASRPWDCRVYAQASSFYVIWP
jgi:hypothetical protein